MSKSPPIESELALPTQALDPEPGYSPSFLFFTAFPCFCGFWNFAIERLLSNICSSFEALSASIPIGYSLFHNQ